MISLYDTSDALTSFEDIHKKPSIFKIMLTLIQFLVFIALLIFFVGTASYIYVGYTTYIDYPNQCFIKVDKDVLKGNRDTIFDALANLKVNNTADYLSVCRYVDNIVEAECLLGDTKTPKLRPIVSDGCFIKGTRTIFIKPDNRTFEGIVELRKNQILKYAKLSQQYFTAN